MKTSSNVDPRLWMQALKDQCEDLICCADGLLDRYPRQRRRSGLTLSPLLKVLKQLRIFSATLSLEDQHQLLLWEAALAERLHLLLHRRIPPTSPLRQFRAQCRILSRQLTWLQVSAVSLLDPNIPWQTPDVLVGSLRRPSQLDICLIHGFYHIPVSMIPRERLPIRYVAIYQSRSLFPEDCGIRFYGLVKRCVPVRRWEISEIPKSSDEWYYRIEVVRWEQLKNPIAVREVPFTHLFTNHFLLTHSRETPELCLQSEWEYRRFQTLKAALRTDGSMTFRYPGGTLRLNRSTLRIYRGMRPIATYQAEDFHRTPAAVFADILKYLKKQ